MAFRKIYEKVVAIEKHDDHCDVYTYFEAYCNSEDVKPTKLVAEGSNAIETDTGDWYFFKEAIGEWEPMFNVMTGGGGGEVRPYSVRITPTASNQTFRPSDFGNYNYFSRVTVEAISPTKVAERYIPSTVDQVISKDQWLTGDQTIMGDATLIPDNIKKGVTIFGRVGNYVGAENIVLTGMTARDPQLDGNLIFGNS